MLRLVDGDGVLQLLDVDDEQHAMLLERDAAARQDRTSLVLDVDPALAHRLEGP